MILIAAPLNFELLIIFKRQTNLFSKDISDSHDISGFSDEGSKDHIDSHFNTEEQVSLVLLGNSWEINFDSWQVASLLRSEFSAVLDFADDGIWLDIDGLDGDETIVDEDQVALLDDFGEVLVVDVDLVLGALFEVGFVEGKGDFLALDESDNGGTAANEETCSDFRPLRVESDSDGLEESLLGSKIVDGFSDVEDSLAVVVVGSVGEVHSDNVHASFDQFSELFDGSRDWANGADNVGASMGSLGGVDV